MNTQQMVAKAAKWMDGFKPRWYRDIDLSKFDLVEPALCILGQTFPGGDYYELAQRAPEGLQKAFLAGGDEPDDYYKNDEDGDNAWTRGLTEFWIWEIKYRCESE